MYLVHWIYEICKDLLRQDPIEQQTTAVLWKTCEAKAQNQPIRILMTLSNLQSKHFYDDGNIDVNISILLSIEIWWWLDRDTLKTAFYAIIVLKANDSGRSLTKQLKKPQNTVMSIQWTTIRAVWTLALLHFKRCSFKTISKPDVQCIFKMNSSNVKVAHTKLPEYALNKATRYDWVI